jgi:hypothetical protein
MNYEIQQQIDSLETLKLQKKQLIWNKEIEVNVIENFDEPTLKKAELSGGDEGQLNQMRQAITADKQNCVSEIMRAQFFIAVIDKRLEQLRSEHTEG